MPSTKTTVSYQGTVSIEEAKSVLRDLLTSLDEGKVVIRRGGDHVALTPAEHVELELAGKQKKDRQSLAIELSWRLQAPLEASAGVLISSQEPEPEPPEAALTVDAGESPVGEEDGDGCGPGASGPDAHADDEPDAG